MTEAGRVLLREAKHILQLSQQAIDATRQAGLESPLRMGVFKTLLRSRILNVMNLLSEQLPQAPVKLIELPSFLSVQQALVEGVIDVGLTILPLQHAQLAALPVAYGNMAVLLPQQHPLASLPDLTLSQLENEIWVEIPPPLNPVFEAVEALCREAGFKRKITQDVSSLELLADLVQVGKGVALVPSHFDCNSFSGVVAKPLVDSQKRPYAELELQHVVAFLVNSTLPAVIALEREMCNPK